MHTRLTQYNLDPSDRLTGVNTLLRFYCAKRIASEVEGDITRHFFEHNAQPLALRASPMANSLLLATDQQACVLNSASPQGRQLQTFSPYGHHPAQDGLLSALGFNGERPEPMTGHYLLGQGYRAYNPALMRFNSTDNLSPFGEGGINSYAYCEGNPVNQIDPDGHSKWGVIRKNLGKIIAPNRAKKVRSHSFPTLTTTVDDSDKSMSFIGWHGSTTQSGESLKSGLKASYMDSSAGLSSGRGFYVGPTKGVAQDFAEVAASYTPGAEPKVYSVFMNNFSSKMPGRDYRFATMGEGGLAQRQLGEMEILIKEHQYLNISIRDTRGNSRQVLPRASEAPF